MANKRSKDTNQQLRSLYDRRIKDACESALKNDGQVPADCVENLNRLKQLADTADASRQGSLQKHGIVVIALLCTLLVSSILLFVHMRQTEIGLDLAVSELVFSLDSEQFLSPGAHLVSVGVSGLQKIELSDMTGMSDRTIAATDGSGAILLALPPKQTGSVTLPSVMLHPGTHVSLRSVGPQRYRLSLDPPKSGIPPFAINYEGAVQVGLAQERAQTPSGAGPSQALLYPGAGRIDLDIEVAPGSRMDLAQQWRVKGLSLARVERFMDANQTSVRTVSTVLSGTLFMDSLNGEQRTMRAGEGLRFEDSLGDLRTLSIEANPISVQYQGDVRGMTTGFGSTRTSLMPTVLEWLRARHGLSLLWGSTLYLFGLLAGVLRWLKVMQ